MIINDKQDYIYWYRKLELHVWDQDDKEDAFMEKVERALIDYEKREGY